MRTSPDTHERKAERVERWENEGGSLLGTYDLHQIRRDLPEKPIFGPEIQRFAPPMRHRIKPWRSVAKAVSWRVIGTIDTLILSYLLITYLGPYLGSAVDSSDAIQAASLIAITEVATKFVLYYSHERAWSLWHWGVRHDDGRRRESAGRSTLKTGVWRVIASLDTFLLAWFYTGSVATGLSIGGLEVFTKLALYFVHERVWARLPIGIVIGKRHPLVEGK